MSELNGCIALKAHTEKGQAIIDEIDDAINVVDFKDDLHALVPDLVLDENEMFSLSYLEAGDASIEYYRGTKRGYKIYDVESSATFDWQPILKPLLSQSDLSAFAYFKTEYDVRMLIAGSGDKKWLIVDYGEPVSEASKQALEEWKNSLSISLKWMSAIIKRDFE